MKRQVQFRDDHGFLIDTIQTANGYVHLRERTRVDRGRDRAREIITTAPKRIQQTIIQTAITSRSLWQRFIAWLLALLGRLTPWSTHQRMVYHPSDSTTDTVTPHRTIE